MKDIENQLNLPDSSSTHYDSYNLAATKANFFDEKGGNADFKKQVQENLKNPDHLNAFANIDQLNDTPKNFETLYQLYKDQQEIVFTISEQKGVSARDIEKLFLLVEDELRNNQHDTENQKALHFILSSIETAYTKATQQEVEETLLLAMVGGPMQYLRTVDASHNLQNDLKMEGNVVSAMIGTGERTQITIDYGQANPLIRVSDFLHKENGAYEIGLEHTNLTNLPIPFPSEQQLLNTAIRTVQANTATFKKETKNLTEYQEMMSKAIYEQQMKLFEGKLGEDRLSSEIMKQQIQKNITSQKGFTLFQTLLAYNGGQGTLPETFSPETIPEPFFKCIQGMDRCIEHATPSQLQQLNATIDAFLLIIQSLQNPQSDTFKHNKSELFSNATLFPQMMENTQNLLKGKTDENISSLNLFDVVFTHCFPSSPTTTNADIAKGIQCFSDFIAYNKDGNLSNKPFLAPIITAWDKHSVSPPE